MVWGVLATANSPEILLREIGVRSHFALTLTQPSLPVQPTLLHHLPSARTKTSASRHQSRSRLLRPLRAIQIKFHPPGLGGIRRNAPGSSRALFARMYGNDEQFRSPVPRPLSVRSERSVSEVEDCWPAGGALRLCRLRGDAQDERRRAIFWPYSEG